MDVEGPFDEDEDGPDNIFEQIRVSFPILAMAALLLAAAGAGTIGGLVAAGVGGEPLQRPSGFTFQTQVNGSVTELVIRHTGGVVPNSERVYVVDEADNRVPWSKVRTGEGVARITGASGLNCLQQGATYRIVFEGRTTSGTIAAHEITVPISTASVGECRQSSESTEN
ncbi:MAG: hypothetical protein ABEI99_05650 [Halobaculum sp.]